MVTAETAAVLPVLALLTAAGLWGISAVGAQIRCSDAAREAARAAARGDPSVRVAEIAARAAPRGAVLSSVSSGGLVTVTVTVRVGPLGRWLPAVDVSGNAVAELEPEPGR
jgi:Flp pilus assembly protein TadG